MSTNDQFLFIGLGNPGREYKFTRHNIGFLCIDELASRLAISINRVKNKALIGDGIYHESKVKLAKPQTYMNLSGSAVSSLVKYFKVDLSNTMIIHDDLDLPFGTIRLRPAGSSGGQKGLRSVIDSLGTEQIPRLRVGIGRPPGQMSSVNYVLQRFTTQDEIILQDVLDRSVKACLSFIDDGIERAMSVYNQTPQDKECF